MPVAMLPRLGQTLREAREDALPRLTREAVASVVGCSLDKVRNLEGGRAWPRAPHDVDVMVAAYAQLTGIAALVIWGRALDRWRTEDADPATQFVDEAEQAGPPPDEHDESPEADRPDEDEEDAAP